MILASNSPRRAEILKTLGFNLTILPSNIEENIDKNIDKNIEMFNKSDLFISEKELIDSALLLSKKKASTISELHRDSFVVGADTMVYLDGKILGKPKDLEQAKQFLVLLSNKTHLVVTAFCLLNFNKNIEIYDYDLTEVTFNNLDNELIDWYLEVENPFDKAGGYGIQGKGAVLVRKIDGDYFNVMGFPVSKFIKNLRDLGLTLKDINNL